MRYVECRYNVSSIQDMWDALSQLRHREFGGFVLVAGVLMVLGLLAYSMTCCLFIVHRTPFLSLSATLKRFILATERLPVHVRLKIVEECIVPAFRPTDCALQLSISGRTGSLAHFSSNFYRLSLQNMLVLFVKVIRTVIHLWRFTGKSGL